MFNNLLEFLVLNYYRYSKKKCDLGNSLESDVWASMTVRVAEGLN